MHTRIACLLLLTLFLSVNICLPQTAPKEEPWSAKVTVLDVCSCNLLCPCLFNTHPDKDFCKYNTVVKFEKGNYGKVKLDGMKVWMAGDMGADFSNGEMKSMYMAFEPAATEEQVDAAMKVLAHVLPGKAKDTGMERAPILWERKGKTIHAKLGEGQGEVTLNLLTGKDGKNPVTLTNFAMGSERKNSGLMLGRSTHHYKGHNLDYAYEGTNGVLVTVESSAEPAK